MTELASSVLCSAQTEAEGPEEGNKPQNREILTQTLHQTSLGSSIMIHLSSLGTKYLNALATAQYSIIIKR